ncbi:redoxin domain-containing protein [Candidatus Nitrosopelagicus sp.]|nr:redoxin domain-containing protein [Candidatus Nitrosopelagicus sp.]
MTVSRKILFLTFSIILFTSSVSTVYAQESSKTYPNFYAFDYDGDVMRISDLESQVVLLNVWATWCFECLEEMPYLNELNKEYSPMGLKTISLSIDTHSPDFVKSFSDDMDMTTEMWYDPQNNASREFRMMGPPITLLLNGNGELIHEWKGPIFEGTDVELRIESALGITSTEESQQQIEEFELSQMDQISIGVAFAAGLLSFLSPCVLPLIPAYATFITGMSLKDLSNIQSSGGKQLSRSDEITESADGHEEIIGQTSSKFRIQTMVLSKGLLFVLGFSIIFVILGSAVSYAGTMFDEASLWIERIGGIVLIAFGLHLIGILKLNKLNMQKSINFQNRSTKNIGSLFVGMAFGAGWTPCIGPILAGILTMAAASSSWEAGTSLLIAYSAGLAIPFILSALAIDRFMSFFKRIKRWIGWIERGSGILLIGIGGLLLTGSLSALASYFPNTEINLDSLLHPMSTIKHS